jgi:hypothetical protein
LAECQFRKKYSRIYDKTNTRQHTTQSTELLVINADKRFLIQFTISNQFRQSIKRPLVQYVKALEVNFVAHAYKIDTVRISTKCLKNLRKEKPGNVQYVRFLLLKYEYNDSSLGRDICNCSICRSRKGFPATGILAPSALNKGFPSVAHYIINTFLKKDSDGKEEEGATKDEETAELEEFEEDEENTGDVPKSKESSKRKAATPKEDSPPPKKSKSETKKKTSKKEPKTSKQSQKEEKPTKTLKQATLNFKTGAVEAKEGELIACRAPKGHGDYFWIARLVHETRKKNSKTVLVQWFEKVPKKKGKEV